MAKIILLFCALAFAESNLDKIVLFQGDSVAVLRFHFDSISPSHRVHVTKDLHFQIEFKNCNWGDSLELPEGMQKRNEVLCGLDLQLYKESPYTLQQIPNGIEVRFPTSGVLKPIPWGWYSGIGSALIGGAALVWWIGSDSPQKNNGIPDPSIPLPE